MNHSHIHMLPPRALATRGMAGGSMGERVAQNMQSLKATASIASSIYIRIKSMDAAPTLLNHRLKYKAVATQLAHYSSTGKPTVLTTKQLRKEVRHA